MTPRDSVAHGLYEAVFREQRRALLGFLRRRVGNDDDAAEIAQEAYLRLLRYADQTDAGALKALLFRIAANLVVQHARLAQRRRHAAHVPLDELTLVSEAPGQERQLLDRERLALLNAAIRELPERCREVFVLSRFRGMPYQEIARHCGISVKMVEKHITRALAACRARVGDDER